jgi:phenylalanine-4-hydroxylase
VFRPFFKYQQAWLAFCHQQTLNTNISVWEYLQIYLMPLIKQHASSYHVEGIRLLKLDAHQPPGFEEFRQSFYKISNGFDLQEVDDEIDPIEYFTLIQQGKFPCIKRIRSHSEMFCAGDPDFWHEAIGHIAPLCFPEVQAFYSQVASFILASKNNAEYKHNVAVAWTLTEYGFIEENKEHKMFGAALVGSHLAHMRYMRGLIAVETAEREAIIESGFYEEHSATRRDREGILRFFCMEDLNVEIKRYLENPHSDCRPPSSLAKTVQKT